MNRLKDFLSPTALVLASMSENLAGLARTNDVGLKLVGAWEGVGTALANLGELQLAVESRGNEQCGHVCSPVGSKMLTLLRKGTYTGFRWWPGNTPALVDLAGNQIPQQLHWCRKRVVLPGFRNPAFYIPAASAALAFDHVCRLYGGAELADPLLSYISPQLAKRPCAVERVGDETRMYYLEDLFEPVIRVTQASADRPARWTVSVPPGACTWFSRY